MQKKHSTYVLIKEVTSYAIRKTDKIYYHRLIKIQIKLIHK